MNDQSSSHDVVIVGARAAGASTAMLLARAGLDVVMVDRSRHGADTLSTHALVRAGVIQLHRWGVLDAVVAAGTPPVRRTTFTYGNDVLSIPVKPAHGVDALYAPRRTVLDPILVDAAVAAGASPQFGVTVTDVTRDGTGRVDGILGRDGRGRRIHHSGRWVIGADGLRSVVAERVHAPVERLGLGATACVYAYWPGFDVDGYHQIFRPTAYAGIIPTNADHTCVFAGGSPERVGRGGLGVLHDVVRDASPELADHLAASVPPVGTRTFTGAPGCLRTPWGPGWALVGDAGYYKDPVSAHGLTDALRDAELLARAVVASVGDPTAEDDAFADFHETRNRLSTELFDVVDTIATMGWTDAEIPELLLRMSMAMGDEVKTVASLGDLTAIAA